MKIEVGKTYKTISGKQVTIVCYVASWGIYRTKDGIDYDKDGKASVVLMFKGSFRMKELDLVFE